MSENATGPGTGRTPPWTPPDPGRPPAGAAPYPYGPPPAYGWQPAPGAAQRPYVWPSRRSQVDVLRTPSGPSRPVFREPFPIRGGAVALGMVGGGLWMMLFGLLASTARGYAWITILAGLVAWLVALLLARMGDRGAAVGLAMSTAVGLAIAMIVVTVRWVGGTWLLW